MKNKLKIEKDISSKAVDIIDHLELEEVYSPKPTMVPLPYACSEPDTVMVKLKNTFVTIMAML